MRLQFDAIYCLNQKQASIKLDISQILLDFCLFSDYIMRHRARAVNQNMFYFIEALKEATSIPKRSNLFFGDGFLADYTHIQIGHDKNNTFCTNQVLAFLSNPSKEQKPSNELQPKQTSINQGLIDVLSTVETSKRRRIGNLAKSQNSFGRGSPEQNPSLLSDLRQRNSHIQRRRMKYTRKFQFNQRIRQNEEQKMESFKIGKGVMNFFLKLYNEGIEEKQYDLNTSNVSSVHQIPNLYGQNMRETQISEEKEDNSPLKIQYMNTEIGQKKYNPFNLHGQESQNMINGQIIQE